MPRENLQLKTQLSEQLDELNQKWRSTCQQALTPELAQTEQAVNLLLADLKTQLSTKQKVITDFTLLERDYQQAKNQLNERAYGLSN